MTTKIQQHLFQYDYDVKKNGDARFMDQKVTPNILCIIADCVLNFDASQNLEFTKDDIWNDNYFNTNVKGVFNNNVRHHGLLGRITPMGKWNQEKHLILMKNRVA